MLNGSKTVVEKAEHSVVNVTHGGVQLLFNRMLVTPTQMIG